MIQPVIDAKQSHLKMLSQLVSGDPWEEPWIYMEEGVFEKSLRANKAVLPCGFMAHLAEIEL